MTDAKQSTYVRKPAIYCHNCKTRLVPGGPTPRHGHRYCSKPDCVSARDAARYAADRQLTRADAPTHCSCCDEELPARKVRRGDSPLGRWCRRAACQRHRVATEANATKSAGGTTVEIALLKAEFAEALLSEDRVECEDCGLEDAVPGFRHPAIVDGSLVPCEGTGAKNVAMTMIEKVWPDVVAQMEA